MQMSESNDAVATRDIINAPENEEAARGRSRSTPFPAAFARSAGALLKVSITVPFDTSTRRLDALSHGLAYRCRKPAVFIAAEQPSNAFSAPFLSRRIRSK